MKRMEERKRLPVSLQEQLFGIFRDHISDALPPRKTRSKRVNGQGVPLMAWMAGASKGASSRICSVTNGSARFPYTHWGYGTSDLAERIGRRYGVTWVQQALITERVFMHYRGRANEFRRHLMGTVLDEKPLYEMTTWCSLSAIREACAKLKITPGQLPLRALIDGRVTNIILLMQLNETLKRA